MCSDVEIELSQYANHIDLDSIEFKSGLEEGVWVEQILM